MRSLVLPAITGVLSLAGAACNVYDASLVGDQALSGCGTGSQVPPSRPAASTEGADVPELVFALRGMKLEQLGDESWRTIGFNLDGRCTSAPALVAECSPPSADTPIEDGDLGVDNVFGSQLYSILALSYNPDPNIPGDSLEAFTQRWMDRGVSAFIVRVRNYNGQPNDPQVTVDISQSVFGTTGNGTDTPPSVKITNSSSGATATQPNGQPLPLPAWNGDDWFWTREDAFAGGNASFPFLQDTMAYVANGKLVINLPMGAQIKIVGPGLGISVPLTGGVAVGDISTDPNATLNVTVAGRWSIPDLLTGAASVGVCPGDISYNVLLSNVNRFADVRRDAIPVGMGGTSTKCDAISLGVTLTGMRAHFGGVATGLPIPNQCP